MIRLARIPIIYSLHKSKILKTKLIVEVLNPLVIDLRSIRLVAVPIVKNLHFSRIIIYV